MSAIGLKQAGILAALALIAATPARLCAQTASPERPFDERWQGTQPQPAKKAQPAQAQAAKPEPKPQAKLPVSIEQALYLIRSTLLTLNDADRSGNYTVFHDLAAPGFQQRNTAADLSVIFADLRRRHFDLFSTALTSPLLSAAPQLDANGMLRLTGYFPTRPLQIDFDLEFQNTNGEWRIFGISVATPQAPPLPPPPQAQAAKPKGK
jgi:hypothetical protein